MPSFPCMFSRLKRKWSRSQMMTTCPESEVPNHAKRLSQQITAYFMSENIVLTESETRALLVHFVHDMFCSDKPFPDDLDYDQFIFTNLPTTISISDFKSYIYNKIEHDCLT